MMDDDTFCNHILDFAVDAKHEKYCRTVLEEFDVSFVEDVPCKSREFFLGRIEAVKEENQ